MSRYRMSTRYRFLVFALFAGIGAFLVLMSLGYVELGMRRRAGRCYLPAEDYWVLTCVGLAFIGAGLCTLLQKWESRLLVKMIGFATFCCFMIALGWGSFFSICATTFSRVFVGGLMSLMVIGSVYYWHLYRKSPELFKQR